MKSLVGSFLIANSTLFDENFQRTVTLIVDHDEQGAIGLVINQRSAGTLQELIGTGVQIPREVPMYKGGPVRRDMIAVLHKDPESNTGSKQVSDGIYWGSSLALISELIESNRDFNVYSGYAGWSPGQLEDEIANKSWIISKASSSMIFTVNTIDVWRKCLKIKGGIYKYFADKVKDPLLN